jgi:hypothetical protein
VTLNLTSLVLSDTSTFQFFVINPSLSRCNPPLALGPLQSCSFEVGPVAGQVGPKSAALDLVSDDPVHPTVSIQLVLQ